MRHKKHKKENYWISLSDVMSGLMLIFLFIAISYMLKVERREKEKNEIVEEFQNTKIELYEELKKEFEEDFKKSNWNAVLEDDLSIRFLNEEVLFDYNDAELKPEFKSILQDFFPRYIEILVKEQYRDKIKEVRIEGHTDSKGGYMYNIGLSQARTASVLQYVLFDEDQHYFFHHLPYADKKLVQFWLTANGLSSGRTLDNEGQLTILSGKSENADRSRRVEFRIVTRTEEVVEELIAKIQE